MTLRLTPARFALSYISLGVIALALLAVPLWYGFQANLGTFRSYIPAAEMQRFVDLFHRDGAKAVAAAVDAYAKSLPPDQVALFVDPQKRRLAGNLAHWPAKVPDAPGTYGLVIERDGTAPTRVVVAHVGLPEGYVLLMGRESVIFDSLVARFWFGIAGAIAILLSLGLLFGWLLRRAHGQLEGLVARRTEALQFSEERYSMAIEASEEGFVDVNVDTGEFVTSERLNEIFGIAPGTRFSSRSDYLSRFQFYGDDGETYLQTIRAIEAGGGPDRYQFEFRIRLSTGKVRWIWTRGKVMRDADGRARRRIGVFSDITSRKSAEDALRLSEERYARAMEGSDAGHWEWNIVSDEMFFSERAREMLALPPGELPMRRSQILELIPVHPDDRAGLAEMVNAALRSKILAHDYRVIAAPGQPRWLRVRAKVYDDARGAAVRMTGSLTDITERKVAADALRTSEERYSLAIEASEEGHFDIRYDTKEQFYSDRLLELVGIPPGTHFSSRAEPLKVLRFFSASDAQLYLDTIRSVEARNGPNRYEFEFRIMLSSGEMRWLRTRGKITRDSEGNIHRRTGVAADITEAKLAAEALRTSEERYSLAMDASEEAHFDVNVDADELFTSERLNQIYGFPTGTHILKRSAYLKDFRFYGNDAEIYHEGIRAVEAKGGPERYEFEYRIVRPSGEVRWLRTRGKVTRDAEGRARRRTGMVADITEANLAAEALRASEERYSLAMEASEEGHFDWNVRTDDIFVSPHIKQVFGFPLDAEFRTRNDLTARIPYHPDDAPWLVTMARDTLAGSALAHEFEYRIVRGGKTHWLQARWKIFRDAAGTAQRVVGVVTDVTERKRAEEELKAMELKLRRAHRLEAMGTLAGGVAHDFNNILGAILGFGEMAMRDAAKDSRLWRDLDCILEAGERGRALIDRVLAFSRSSVRERVTVHVERVVREALDQLSAKLPPDVTLHAKLHGMRAAIQGDATQVHQVVMNLATNAIQAMPGGGALRVSLRVERIEEARAPTIGSLAPAEYVVLQVTDTGTGIAAEVLERMFDPFFTTKEVGTGTGLGLSIVHGTVTELGGAIDVASKVGAGSTFTIYLPRAGDAVEADLDEKLSPPRGDGQRVLVVDDEEPLVKLATRTLKELGYSPVGFTSSRAALAAFRADPQRFDAVITDERMPGMSGSALIRKVRGIRDSIPVVLMSGYVGDAVARQAREAGAEEVLRKPLSAHDLATSLARVLHT